MTRITYTHKGWFGICPVYIGDVDSDCPQLDERHWLFVPLFDVSAVLYDALFWVATAVNPEYQPMWPLRITGELSRHVVREAVE